MKFYNPRLLLSFFALTCIGTLQAVGPTSTLYLVNYNEFGVTTGLDRIQGATLNSTNTGNNYDFAIAVSGDVRTCGYNGGATGSRFDLSGIPLVGGPYSNTYAADPILDGTSDGKYNYGVGIYGGTVIQYDRNWANPVTLFTDTSYGNYHTGITIDARDGSFWLSQYGNGDLVEHYTHTGTLLSSFNSGLKSSIGLALDPADGTLWFGSVVSPGSILQYDQAGNFLQQANYVVAGAYFYGMEFNTAVPEPASLAALGIGVAALLKRRRKLA